MYRSKSAFTLVEMMVAIVLLMIATTLLAAFFSFFSHQMMRYEGRQDLVLRAEKAMMRIQQTMSEARSSLVVSNTTINGIYFPTADSSAGTVQFNTSGALVWQGWFAYGLDSTGTLWEARQPWASTDAAGQAPTVSPTTWTHRALASLVQQFQVTGPVNNAYRIFIRVQDSSGYQAQFVSTVVSPN